MLPWEKLLNSLKYDEKKIRNVLGMCLDNYILKDSESFKFTRKNLVRYCNCEQKSGFLVQHQGRLGLDLVLENGFNRSMFWDVIMVSGLWRMDLSVEIVVSNPGYFGFGVASSSTVDDIMRASIGDYYPFLCLDVNSVGIINKGGSYNQRINSPESASVSTIAAEIDMNLKTLHFFYNGSQLPAHIKDIPFNSLQFGVSSSLLCKHLVKFISLQRLTSPTADLGLESKALVWKNKRNR